MKLLGGGGGGGGKSKNLLASGGEDFTVRLWDLTAANEGGSGGSVAHARRTLVGHKDAVLALETLWPHAPFELASGSRDSTVKVWTTQNGRCVHTLVSHTAAVTSLAYVATLRMLASGSCAPDASVKLWTLHNRAECVRTLSASHGGATLTALRAFGDLLLSGAEDGTLNVWSLNESDNGGMMRVRTTMRGHTGTIADIQLVPGDLIKVTSSVTTTTLPLTSRLTSTR